MLLVDAYERLAPLDRWIRERFLAELPAGALAVLAGRAAPSADWRADPSWAELPRSVSLRNLPPEDGAALLAAAAVPPALHARALELTHGHPLALSLVADLLRQEPQTDLDADVPPDVVHALLQRFLEGVPSPAHRRALEVAAHVRATTESLLRTTLSDGDAHELFGWLRSLSFIEQGAGGGAARPGPGRDRRRLPLARPGRLRRPAPAGARPDARATARRLGRGSAPGALRHDLPFSTYRRHLARGIERVVAPLWERELHGPDG